MSGLARFHLAQQGLKGRPSYKKALGEIQRGRKSDHWIWYILPQLNALGFSDDAQYYGIQDAQEACDYLGDKTLFDNYFEIIKEILNQSQHHSITYIMGSSIDAKKLMSSLSLFKEAALYLDALKQEPFHDYKGLVQTCDELIKAAIKDKLFLCQNTLMIIKPQLMRMSSPLAASKKIDTSFSLVSSQSNSSTTDLTSFNTPIKTIDNTANRPASVLTKPSTEDHSKVVISPSAMQYQQLVKARFDKIDLVLLALESKIGKVNQHYFSEAVKTANTLLVQLKKIRDSYYDELLNKRDSTLSTGAAGFRIDCATEIAKAKNVLERDLSWGDYLLNMMKALANAVIGMFTANNSTAFFSYKKAESLVAVEYEERNLTSCFLAQ